MDEPKVQASFTEWELRQLIRARLNTAGTLEDAKALAELDHKLGFLYGGVKKLKDHHDATIEKHTRRGPLLPHQGGISDLTLKLLPPDQPLLDLPPQAANNPHNPNGFYS